MSDLQQPFLKRTFSEITPGSVRGSIFTLASSAIGAGLLALPLVLSQSGAILGIIMIFVACILALFSIEVMVACGDSVGIKDYGKLTTSVLGPLWGDILEVVLVVYCFGASVAYMCVIENSVGSIFDALGVTGFFGDKRIVLIFCTVFIVLPLSLLKNLSALRYASIFSIFSMVYVCFAVFGKAWSLASFDNLDYFIIDENFFTSATMCIFAFTAHVNLYPIYKELQRPDPRRMRKVAIRSAFVEVSLYLLIAVSGYLSFHDTDGNVLENYDNHDIAIIVGRVAVSSSMCIALPLCLNPARLNLYSLMFKQRGDGLNLQADKMKIKTISSDYGSGDVPPSASEWADVNNGDLIQNELGEDDSDDAIEVSTPLHLLVTVILVGSCMGLAIAVPSVSVVFGFLGATCSIFFCYILPISLYLTIFRSSVTPLKKYSLIGLLTLVVIIGCTSVGISIKQSINGENA